MLTGSKVMAGGLAAATTAVLGSYFGVLGTVGGAAAGSVATALSSEIYQRSIDRTAERLRRSNPSGQSRGQGPPEATGPAAARGLSVGSIVFGSILIFALGIAAVTGIEYFTGRPISGGDGGTTLSHLSHLDVGSALGDLLGGSSSDGSSSDHGLLGGLLGG
ncbi:MAG TPA: hypothetical protein VIQ30_13610 [Pseudonocardia sp.]